MIVVIDYGMGNIASISNALEYLEAEFIVSRDINDIERAERLILPGVGSFRKAMDYLNEYGLINILNKKVLVDKTPILGICLGMQLFAESGTEDAKDLEATPGLNWIKGHVVKIPTSNNLRIPHMGFNEIIVKNHSNLLDTLPQGSHFYFVHSYHFNASFKNDVIAVTSYGTELVAIVEKANISGVQFHPEKSQDVGLKLLENFLKKKFYA